MTILLLELSKVVFWKKKRSEKREGGCVSLCCPCATFLREIEFFRFLEIF